MQTATHTSQRNTANAAARPPAGAGRSDPSFGECRQRLISYLMKLNHALNEDLPDLSHALLSRFCDALVHYLSAGHFEVFERASLCRESCAVMALTTQAGMAFHDRFGTSRSIRVVEVKAALEQLARVLSTRFETEDQLLRGQPR